MPTETGIFTQHEAANGHLFSYRLARYIGRYFSSKRTVYDMGCGNGAYSGYLQDVGFFRVFSVDGVKCENSFVEIFEFDLTNECFVEKLADFTMDYYFEDPARCSQLAGNVICIEVGEHIPKHLEQQFIDNICSFVAKDCSLIVSWAHEGQQGYGHVNCRPGWYVIEQFEKRGFKLNLKETEQARSVIEGHVAYLKENLFIFDL